MAKATRVYLDRKRWFSCPDHIFRIIDDENIGVLCVNSFEDGIVTIKSLPGDCIDDFAEVIAGCFEEGSNFGTEVIKAFNCDKNTTTFKEIQFDFNEVIITVTKDNANKDAICKDYQAKIRDYNEKRSREHEAWLKSPEGQKYLEQKRAEEARKKAIRAEVLHIDETTEMEFKDDEAKKAWNEMVELNLENEYGMYVVNFARRWAKYMQKLITEGKTVEEIALQTSYDCDIEGITGNIFGRAVRCLSKCWKYGEVLHKWYNKRYGYEGKGFANPSMLVDNNAD